MLRRAFLKRLAAGAAALALPLPLMPTLISSTGKPVVSDTMEPARQVLFFRPLNPDGTLGAAIELGEITDTYFEEEHLAMRSWEDDKVKDVPIKTTGTISFNIPHHELSPEVRALLGVD